MELANIVDDKIVITIPTDRLDGFACEGLSDVGLENDAQLELIDFPLLIKEIVSELNAEEEDGTTLIHKALDQAVRNASDNGSEALYKLCET